MRYWLTKSVNRHAVTGMSHEYGLSGVPPSATREAVWSLMWNPGGTSDWLPMDAIAPSRRHRQRAGGSRHS